MEPVRTRWSFVAVAAALTLGCQRGDDATQRALPSADVEGATASFAGLSAKERASVAATLCATATPCSPSRARALVAAASDAGERDALREAASRGLFARAEQELAAKMKPGQVGAEGAGKRTLHVTSVHCDRFLMENLIGSPTGETAKALGFDRVRCQHQGLSIEAALGD